MNEDALLPWWTNFLHLVGFRVVRVSTDRPTDPVRLTVLPTADVALCPHCQRPCDSIHRHYQSEPVKDLPLATRPVELIVRTYQFSGPHCHHFFTPPAPAVAPGAHATQRFLE